MKIFITISLRVFSFNCDSVHFRKYFALIYFILSVPIMITIIRLWRDKSLHFGEFLSYMYHRTLATAHEPSDLKLLKPPGFCEDHWA